MLGAAESSKVEKPDRTPASIDLTSRRGDAEIDRAWMYVLKQT
jgi:hypothetical protein